MTESLQPAHAARADGEWLDHVLADDEDMPPPLPHDRDAGKGADDYQRNTSPDVGFDQSINAYRGCEHGCIYCFARPSHALLDLSPGLDFRAGCS